MKKTPQNFIVIMFCPLRIKKTSQYHQNVAFSSLAGCKDFNTTQHLAKLRNTNYFTSVLISSSKTIDLSFISSGMRLNPLFMQT